MATIRYLESISTTNDVSASNVFASNKISGGSGEFSTFSAAQASATNIYGNLIGTFNGLPVIPGSVIPDEQLRQWNNTYLTTVNLSAGWQQAAAKTESWNNTKQTVDNNKDNWNSAFATSTALAAASASFIIPAIEYINTNANISNDRFNKTLLVDSAGGDIYLTLNSNVLTNSQTRVVQLTNSKIFFISDDDTNQPILNKNNGNSINKQYADVNIIKLHTGWLITGDLELHAPNDSNTFYWFTTSDQTDWYNIHNWFFDEACTLVSHAIPTTANNVVIKGVNIDGAKPPYIEISNANVNKWANPLTITNTLSAPVVVRAYDVDFTVTSTLSGNIDFEGTATLSADTYYWYFRQQTAATTALWTDKFNWYSNRELTVRGNIIPRANSTAVILENPSISYTLDPIAGDKAFPTSTPLPNILLSNTTSGLFESPRIIDFTNVTNTLNMFTSASQPSTITSTITSSDNFTFHWLGSVTTSNN